MEAQELKIRSCVFKCKTSFKTHAADLISNLEMMKIEEQKNRKVGAEWGGHTGGTTTTSIVVCSEASSC